MSQTAGGDAVEDGASIMPDLAPQEPIPVDPTTPPSDVIRALGYDPDLIQSLVLTATHVVAVAADYPEPQTREEA